MHPRIQGQLFTTPPNPGTQIAERVEHASILLAIGDALGAGIENWNLPDIVQRFGGKPDIHYSRYNRGEKKPAAYGQPGDVTDDTAMSACLMEGLIKAIKEAKQWNEFCVEEFTNLAVQHIQQAFLFWAKSQKTYSGKDGTACKQFIKDNNWATLASFHNTYGMGDGTLNILNQGLLGTLQDLPEKTPDPAKPGKSKYVGGCGALMLVLPIGLLCGEIKGMDAFEMGRAQGVMTHGDPASYISAGITAEIIAQLIRKKSSLQSILPQLKEHLACRKAVAPEQEKQAYEDCMNAIKFAEKELNEIGNYELSTVDELGHQCGDKLFSSVPVFGQALFVALAAEKHQWSADKALKMAVTQSGDSDSVAAVVGAILGVMHNKVHIKDNALINSLNQTHLIAIREVSNKFGKALAGLTQDLSLEKQPVKQFFEITI